MAVILPTPKKFKIVAGAAEGKYTLTSFDKALLEAGIGNINLLRVSSILPPSAEQDQNLKIPEGSLVPTAYGSITCQEPGMIISAAVGIGFSSDTFGVIMEFAGKCTGEEAEERIRAMLEEAFDTRGITLERMLVKSSEHKVEKTATALAAVTLWY